MTRLDEIESRLRDLLEVHLLNYLPGYQVEDKIAQQLAAGMNANLKKQEDITLAPNVYVIVGHPSTLIKWRVDLRLLEKMAEALFTVANEAGFVFLTRPTVTTAADISMGPGETKILASFSSESVAETRGMPSEPKNIPSPEIVPPNAFLVLNGTQILPLTQATINIGRRLDNQVVIDDPRVSRTHAQLRVVRNRFVLFDLNSTGGTYVNGQRMKQSVLYPGDVISLAGVVLIFGQDLPAGRNPDDKSGPTSPFSADRPTAILKKDEFKDKEK